MLHASRIEGSSYPHIDTFLQDVEPSNSTNSTTSPSSLVEPSQTAFLGIDWIGTLTALVTVFGLLAALLYFFFSVEHKGFPGQVSRGGIWILMITFGVALGYTVMGRIALLVGRMEFLFVDRLQLIGP